MEIPQGLDQVRDENKFPQTTFQKYCRQIHEIKEHRFF